MVWEPTQENIVQLAHVLNQSLDPHTPAPARHQSRVTLEEARKLPDFPNYLVYMLVHQKAGDLAVRSATGLLLKNIIRTDYASISLQNRQYIKAQVFDALISEEATIRQTGGSIVTTLVQQEGISGWPEVLTTLMGLAQGGIQTAEIGAMDALAKICEDIPHQLDHEYGSERPLDYMVPKFIMFAQAETSCMKKRTLAVKCLNHLVSIRSQALLNNIDDFMNVLFGLASSTDIAMCTQVCIAFVSILRVNPAKIAPYIEGVIRYSLHCITENRDDNLSLQACEILLQLTEENQETYFMDSSILKSHLLHIIPVILRSMVYSESDVFLMEAYNHDDADVVDREEDMKPTMAKMKASHSIKKQAYDNKKNYNTEEEDDDGEEDEDDDEEDELIGLDEWSLRKCAASTLDALSSSLPEEVLEISMPYLKTNIVSEDWPVREAAILAFGALADSCSSLIYPHLPELVPFLIQRLGDPQFAVRQVSAWTLSRFSEWSCENSQIDRDKYFLPILTGLFACALDRNKKVQISGCSSLATFFESATYMLEPYLEQILEQFGECFRRYQRKSLLILFDVISTLVYECSSAIASNEFYMELLLRPLVAKWDQTSDDDRSLWCLFECMSAVASSLGTAFEPYASPVFERCARLIHNNIIQDQNCINDPSLEPAEKDFIVTAVDLVDALVQGLKAKAAPLLMESFQPPFMEMLLVCFHDPVNDVRQSALALLGDLAVHCSKPLEQYMPQIMQELLPQLEYNKSTDPVINNACWSLGEIALLYQEQLRPLLTPATADSLISILRTRENMTVLENASTAIGRIGITMSEIFAPRLNEFAIPWCRNMSGVQDNDEKESAFMGMCSIVSANPQGLSTDALIMFVHAISNYLEPSPQLSQTFAQILFGLKSMVPDWSESVMNNIPEPYYTRLVQLYNV